MKNEQNKTNMQLNKIYQGDCLELMRNIEDKSVDMILCDLPYGTTACSWDELIDMEELWIQYKRLIKDNGILVFTASQPFTSFLVLSNPNWFSHELIWEKEQGKNFLISGKQPLKIHESILIFQKPMSEGKNQLIRFIGLRKYFEEIYIRSGKSRRQIIKELGKRADHCFRFSSSQWYFPEGKTYQAIEKYFGFELKDYNILKKEYQEESNSLKKKYNPQKVLGKPYRTKQGHGSEVWGNDNRTIITDNLGYRLPTSILRFNREDGLHPTQKPVELFKYLIKTYTNEGDVVLDNCIGSGTTAIACKQSGRDFIGIEIEKKYVDIANRRLAQQTITQNQGDMK